MSAGKRTTNREEIIRWAEERNAVPARVEGTGGKKDVGIIRLDFPKYAEKNLIQISWDEFFGKFDENNLALVYQETTSSGQKSNFNKIIRRNRDEKNSSSSQSSIRKKSRTGVGKVMSEDVVWCTPKSTLEEAALLMTECDCGELPVVRSDDDLEIVGVITDRDIVCRSIGRGENPMNMTVKECMTSPAVTIEANAEIEEAVRLMEESQIRRLVVVENGECCGMLSQADLVESTSKTQAGEVVREISKPSEEASQVRH